MVQVVIKVGDQDGSQGRLEFVKHGDILALFEDDVPVTGRRVNRDIWISEGLAGVDADGIDRSGQTAANWPGGFFIVRVLATTKAQVIAAAGNILDAHADGIQPHAYMLDASGINLALGSITASRSQVLARIVKKG